MKSVSNRAQKDRRQRAKLRAKLRAEGVSEQLIEKIMVQQRQDDLVARLGEDGARAALRNNASRGPDDTGFKPSAGDPLLRGVARVDGVTAKVVRRRNTITRFQYDRKVESGVSDE